MKHFERWLLTLATLFFAACGGTGRPGAPPVSYGASDAPAGYAASDSSSSAGQGQARPSAEASAPSSADGAYEGGAVRPREERPGLGTSWGETRDSRVSTSSFFRMNPDTPDAVAALYYNDAEGVRAMARQSGFSELDDGTVRIAGGALSVRLLDASGRPLRGARSGGRTYAVGEAGDRYLIEIRNNTRSRIEAVTTVDGLDVIDGQPGSFEKRGYIIAPSGSVSIEGFRRSLDEVAAFRFGSVRGSYAAQKGDARNVGVIGVACFVEEGTRLPWTSDEVERRQNADPFPGRFATPPGYDY